MSGDGHRKQPFLLAALRRYETPLTRYAFGITGDLERARDIVQDTFVKLVSQSPERVSDHLAPWLFTVCRNRAFDVHKKESRMSTLDERHLESRKSPDPSPSATLERSEKLGQIHDQMSKLPANQAEVLRLKFQNDLSYREISEITGLSASNVGFLIHRGLRTLRERLGPEARDRAVPLRRVR